MNTDSDIDTRQWLARARKKLAVAPNPRAWTVDDLKLALVLRAQLTRDECLEILEIASGKRFDNRRGIEDFLRIMAAHIDSMGDAK